MSDDVRETPCTHCVHRTICKHKEVFLKTIDAVNCAVVYEREDNRIKMTRVVDIDCVSDISVTCRYRQPKVATPREGIF